jgi:hypothetical protein
MKIMNNNLIVPILSNVTHVKSVMIGASYRKCLKPFVFLQTPLYIPGIAREEEGK